MLREMWTVDTQLIGFREKQKSLYGTGRREKAGVGEAAVIVKELSKVEVKLVLEWDSVKHFLRVSTQKLIQLWSKGPCHIHFNLSSELTI